VDSAKKDGERRVTRAFLPMEVLYYVYNRSGRKVREFFAGDLSGARGTRAYKRAVIGSGRQGRLTRIPLA